MLLGNIKNAKQHTNNFRNDDEQNTVKEDHKKQSLEERERERNPPSLL